MGFTSHLLHMMTQSVHYILHFPIGTLHYFLVSVSWHIIIIIIIIMWMCVPFHVLDIGTRMTLIVVTNHVSWFLSSNNWRHLNCVSSSVLMVHICKSTTWPGIREDPIGRIIHGPPYEQVVSNRREGEPRPTETPPRFDPGLNSPCIVGSNSYFVNDGE